MLLINWRSPKAVLAILSIWSLGCSRPPEAALAGKPAPCIALPDSSTLLDGKPVRDDAIRGLDVDSIFNMLLLTDSAALATYGLCPGRPTVAFITHAEARRLDLRPPPPALCLRGVNGVLPVGNSVRLSAGQLDILSECDREAPPGLSWRSGDTTILTVDSAGTVTARSPGEAEVVVTASTVEAKNEIRVVPAVARIAILADKTVAVGDTVLISAVAYSPDGRALPDVPLRIFSFTEVLQSGERKHAPWWIDHTRTTANSQRVAPRLAGNGWVRASVIGLSDSVFVRVLEKAGQ